MNTTNKILLGVTCLLIIAVVFLGLLYLNQPLTTPVSPVLEHDESDHTHGTSEVENVTTQIGDLTTPITTAVLDSPYLNSYTLEDPLHGNETAVTVTDTNRTIVTNTLPNHEHGDFPSQGNPNSITAINNTYTFPITPIYTGVAKEARQAIVGINGVPFEPGTAERVSCTSGEEYRVVGLQDFLNLGMDMNNAHVQPTGLYHYHGSPTGLIDFADQGNDLVHVGFAADGHLLYYSKSGAYTSSYTLSTTPRSGTSCVISGPGNSATTIAGTMPDGSFEEDWVYSKSSGDLDECNGATINSEYVYMVTEEYPFISRCLMGEFAEEARPAGQNRQPGGSPANR